MRLTSSQRSASFVDRVLRPFADLGIGKLVLVIWLIFSILYIGSDLWAQLREGSYNAGRNDVLSALVTSTQKCQPIDIASRAGNTQIVAVSCLNGGKGLGTTDKAPTTSTK